MLGEGEAQLKVRYQFMKTHKDKLSKDQPYQDFAPCGILFPKLVEQPLLRASKERWNSFWQKKEKRLKQTKLCKGVMCTEGAKGQDSVWSVDNEKLILDEMWRMRPWVKLCKTVMRQVAHSVTKSKAVQGLARSQAALYHKHLWERDTKSNAGGNMTLWD